MTPAAVKTLKPGQSLTYTITVTDGSGKAISGATVTVDDGLLGTSPLSSLTTNGSGQATYTTTVPSGEAQGNVQHCLHGQRGRGCGQHVGCAKTCVGYAISDRPPVREASAQRGFDQPYPPQRKRSCPPGPDGPVEPEAATIRRKMVENLMPSFIRSPME